jgi:hypothetical protein
MLQGTTAGAPMVEGESGQIEPASVAATGLWDLSMFTIRKRQCQFAGVLQNSLAA